ncbi:putative bifunctional diguanylate cyclase/phosphodiesterase [Sphingosinicella rhizophila]|uniref:EAL domain-containing protein n=1 Tax=Sphingosinicella rhizophila TaxID=3050082 RepID=A0ABU3Q4M5_9SPHN|nr:EAL domain-containing protein [Sphingosinicella sp. GR2756]MDT9598366.1 EAL domain-containing protein [Sphingosinicella sp. GR2756]
MSDTSLPKIDWRVVFNRAAPPGHRGWGRVRAAQITEMARVFAVAVWGQVLNALLLVVILKDYVPGRILGLWLLSLASLMLMAWFQQRRWRGREIQSASRRAVQQAAFHSAFFAIAWAIPAKYFAGYAPHPEQLAICVVTAGMMAGAAFILAPLPSAAGCFVVILSAAATNLLGSVGSPAIAAIVPAYLAGLLLIILANGRAFMQRQCERLSLAEHAETVSLLLREYESSDADWLWETNSKLIFRHVSPRFARAVGRSVEELHQMSILDLLTAVQGAEPRSGSAVEQATACLGKRAPFSEVLVPVKDSCIEISARPQFSRRGRFIGYRGVGSDVTEAQQAANRIAYMARHDALTGLPNRMHLLENLGAALDQAQQGDGRCAVLLVDLDRFKTVNDSLGHVAGDHLLQQVSARFSKIVSPEMTVGRLGGDEFAIVIPDAPDHAEIRALGETIVATLEQPFVYHDQHLFVGASVGAAVGPFDGKSVEELIRNADLALYGAKDNGGNEICFYEPSLHLRAEERRRIELALRGALGGGELRLVYQPVIDAVTGRIESCEALMRWFKPEFGEISPAKFIPLAEETGLIVPIGEWALRTACAEAAQWPSEISLAVNISPRQLQDPGFMTMLVSTLARSGLEPNRLELEITETVFLNITPDTRKILHQIRQLGVRLAMDDFGTGYSSLGYLREANFDTLKIDQTFVRSASRDDPDSAAIVRAVVALANSLDMTTVAEGVETQEQLELVCEIGCDRIQGYIFSAPVPANDLRPMFADKNRRAAA